MPMRPNKTDLPRRMLKRTKTLKNGSVWTAYYYNGRDADGRRVEIPLGTDLPEAKRRWAELERCPAPASTMKQVFDRFERDVVPTKAPATQIANRKQLVNLRAAFDDAPIDAITPQHIAQYRDKRTAKVMANRELATLSQCFNLAREWGYTRQENPCRGVRKNKEKPRDYYADEAVWQAVYAQACETLRDAMDLAYLTAQRPADTLKMSLAHIADGTIEVTQNKTQAKLRIRIEGELAAVVDRIRSRKRKVHSLSLVAGPDGGSISVYKLWQMFDAARAAAMESTEDEALARRIRAFQARDIRAKAASDIEDLQAASNLLGHTSTSITSRVYVRRGKVVSPTK